MLAGVPEARPATARPIQARLPSASPLPALPLDFDVHRHVAPPGQPQSEHEGREAAAYSVRPP